MKQQRSPLVQMLSLLVFLFTFLLVSSLLLIPLDRLFYNTFGVFLDLPALQLLLFLLVLLFAIYYAFTSGLLHDAITSIKHKWFDTKQATVPTPTGAPVKIAQFSFKLDDPGQEKLLNRFLDSPLPPSTGQHAMTPVELVEETALEYVRDLEKKYGSNVTVETILRRGSLEAFFQITAVDVVILAAAYHDLVESARLFRGQMNGAVRKVRSAYRRRTGRSLRVTDELEIAPKPAASTRSEDQAPSARDRSDALQPINVTQSYVPPQNNRDMNISINATHQGSAIGGCVNSCLLALLIVVFVVAAFLLLFVDYEERLALLQELINYIGYFMRVVARWLLQLANAIAPTFTEFY